MFEVGVFHHTGLFIVFCDRGGREGIPEIPLPSLDDVGIALYFLNGCPGLVRHLGFLEKP